MTPQEINEVCYELQRQERVRQREEDLTMIAAVMALLIVILAVLGLV